MLRQRLLVLLLVAFLVCSFNCQNSKKAGKGAGAGKSDQGFLMSIVNTILGGPYDAPILTRIMNKVGHFATLLFGSVFAYFKWFRQRKNRIEKINEFIGDEKHKFALSSDEQMNNIGAKTAQKIIYDLNSEKSRQIAVKSNNGSINFNISVEVQDVQEESTLIYNISMQGTDPKGKSKFTGYFKSESNKPIKVAKKRNKYQFACLKADRSNNTSAQYKENGGLKGREILKGNIAGHGHLAIDMTEYYKYKSQISRGSSVLLKPTKAYLFDLLLGCLIFEKSVTFIRKYRTRRIMNNANKKQLITDSHLCLQHTSFMVVKKIVLRVQGYIGDIYIYPCCPKTQ